MSYTNGLDKPSDYFATKLYAGNDSGQSITMDFAPNWVWIKDRGGADPHGAYDSVRGALKQLRVNLTNEERTLAGSLTAFNSDGFTVGNDDGTNDNAHNFVSWNWKETATAGFDIVSFTGNGSARTISHSLSAVPKMYIVKNRSTGSLQWRVYHASLGATKHMALDATQAVGTASSVFNNTEPTSSVFSVGTDDAANKNGDSLIAYLFAEKQGYSKFRSYTGNGNADGTYIHLGFSASFFMLKRTDATAGWTMFDNKRNTTSNPHIHWLIANAADAEETDATGGIDFTANGVKIRSSFGSRNASGGTYIYMAFAENPFVTSTGVCATAR